MATAAPVKAPPVGPTILMPYPHASQQAMAAEARAARDIGARFYVVACGRRWGKTTDGIRRAILRLGKGQRVGWFAPNYKLLDEAWNTIRKAFDVKAGKISAIRKVDEAKHRLELTNGGVFNAWTVNDGDPGRGYAYHLVIIDEAAMISDLIGVWDNAIRPTLTDYKGEAWFLSTPRGLNAFHTLWARGQNVAEYPEWRSWRQPTINNPYISPEEVEAARRDTAPAAFAQEYEAVFTSPEGLVLGLDYDGVPFYDPSRNVLKAELAWSECKWRVVGIDPGGSDPTAMVALGVYDDPLTKREHLHVYRHFRRKGAIDVMDIADWLEPLEKAGHIDAVLVDMADSAGQLGTIISTLSRLGWPAWPANRSRALGIPLLQQAFKAGKLSIDPGPMQAHFESEVYTWMWPPLKADRVGNNAWATIVGTTEHHADLLSALRYAVVGILDRYPGDGVEPRGLQSVRQLMSGPAPSLVKLSRLGGGMRKLDSRNPGTGIPRRRVIR